jgi:hypothetical protein
MASLDPIIEFRTDWLPHVTDEGLSRLLELLKKASPLLIHGAFTRAVPMGCMASHIAWNHPTTCRLQHDAGIVWLSKIAGLNPATSAVILAWDRDGCSNFELRSALISACLEEQDNRALRATDNMCRDDVACELAQ